MSRQDKTSYRPVRSQVVAYTGTAGTITNAIGQGITKVKVLCTTAAFVAIINPNGGAAAAAATDMYVAANVDYYLDVVGGEKISAIQSAAGGNLHVTELS